MKSKLFAAALALAAPFAARAADTGSELAFRTGFSFPFGHFTGAPPGFSPVPVSDLFTDSCRWGSKPDIASLPMSTQASCSNTALRDSNSGEIMDRALHEFLTLGVRASFLP